MWALGDVSGIPFEEVSLKDETYRSILRCSLSHSQSHGAWTHYSLGTIPLHPPPPHGPLEADIRIFAPASRDAHLPSASQARQPRHRATWP